MTNLGWNVQHSIHTALAGDGAVQAIFGTPPRLYDCPPDDAVFPYLLCAESRVKDWPGVTRGLEHEIRIAIFSRYRGRREIKHAFNAVYDVLHEADLIVDGAAHAYCRFVFADIFPRAEAGAYQGVARYRVTTHP